VHLQLHTGRIPAEHFYFIGKEISYKVKTPVKGKLKQAVLAEYSLKNKEFP